MANSNPLAIQESVDSWLNKVPASYKPMLQKLRNAIKEAAPAAEELISYQIPTYKQNGPLVHFAAFEKHCSLIVVSLSVMQDFAITLKPFKTTGRTIHFTVDNPLPDSLVKKIVRQRVAENAARLTSKVKPPATKKKLVAKKPLKKY
jgi:uncharacterized protein YdhG (YjbR/CyaY superfamily)